MKDEKICFLTKIPFKDDLLLLNEGDGKFSAAAVGLADSGEGEAGVFVEDV